MSPEWNMKLFFYHLLHNMSYYIILFPFSAAYYSEIKKQTIKQKMQWMKKPLDE